MLFKQLHNVGKKMKFAEENQDDGYVITAYGENTVSVNGKLFEKSLILATTQFSENWAVSGIDQLATDHIDQVLSFNPELIIIGTGNKLVFPPVEIYAAIIKRGIGVDFMDTHAAYRTYNILMGEGRDVVAGLILQA